jgi:hypothetical protein
MRGPGDLDSAFAAATQAGIDAIYAVSSRHMVASVTRIVDFATKSRLPLAGGWGAWVQAGGLISYGPNVGDMVRLTAGYVNKNSQRGEASGQACNPRPMGRRLWAAAIDNHASGHLSFSRLLRVALPCLPWRAEQIRDIDIPR